MGKTASHFRKHLSLLKFVLLSDTGAVIWFYVARKSVHGFSELKYLNSIFQMMAFY